MIYDELPVYPVETPMVRPVELIPARLEERDLLLVRDPVGVLPGPAVIVPNPLVLIFIELADGKTTFAKMAERVTLLTGQLVSASMFEAVARQFDEALLLQSERFLDAFRRKRDDFLRAPARQASALRMEGVDRLAMIKELASEMRRHRAGSMAPPERLDLPPASVSGILSPHIDYQRGGHAYAWAYQALHEHGIAARTWIVLGTCHNPISQRFAATRKSFETPFGQVETDADVLDDIARNYSGELFSDEYAHASEHSIELQAAYLRHVFRDGPQPKIVPILVGSFDDLLGGECSPRDDEEAGAFCAALHKVIGERDGTVGIIGGVDLSHCGPQFGDESKNGTQREEEIESGDRQTLKAIESGDPDRFFESFRADGNARNVCSIGTIYCAMEALRGRARPTVLTYQQSNSEDKNCLVSFASIAFVREGVQPAGAARIVIVSG
ncbi:MAG: AmmeMemoRadiSam system protein B [Candidatus Sumerlaeota bacterium]|nr:AmmeMemoRadiSam system protein B [Candidatus Sumerlaeota bacterium]